MSNWNIYLISAGNRTYVGATTNVERRLRQHNGEIVGGARSTSGRTWRLVMSLGNFPNKSSAYRWEKLVKSRARGLLNRKNAMFGVYCGTCPGSGKRAYPVPSGLSCTVYMTAEELANA